MGHAQAFTPLPPLRWVEALGRRIAHFHIHDNAGDDDRHLPPGEGTIGFPGLYAAILRHCPQAVLSLEIEPLAGEGPDRVLAALAASRALLARLGRPPGAPRG